MQKRERVSKLQVLEVLKTANVSLKKLNRSAFLSENRHFNNAKTYSLHIGLPGELKPLTTAITDAKIKDVMTQAQAVLAVAKSLGEE